MFQWLDRLFYKFFPSVGKADVVKRDQINNSGLALIKSFEGCRLEAYDDGTGTWTIGYGHTRGVHPGASITQAEAEQLLLDDLLPVELAVAGQTATVPTTSNQFSAMVSLAFNIGTAAFSGSSVLKAHLSEDYGEAADAFLRWNKAHVNGVLVPVPGLLRRRQAERALYLTA